MFGVDDALIAAAISAAASGAGAAAAGSNQSNIANMTRDQLHMSQADKVDAYGNVIHYNPQTNTWETQLTPEQKNLAFAGEREQRLGLTQDAVRNRTIREQLAKIGSGATEDYNTARSGYATDTGPSEGAIRGDILRLIQQGQGQGDRATAQLVDRQALRQQGNMPVINTGSISPDAGQKLAHQLLQARSGALQEYGQRQQQRNQKYLPAMQQFSQEAGLGGNAPIQLPDTEKTLLGETNASAAGANNAYHSAEGATNTAAGLSVKALDSIASSMAKQRMQGQRLGGATAGGQPMSPLTQSLQTPGTNFGSAQPQYDSTQSVPGDNWYF